MAIRVAVTRSDGILKECMIVLLEKSIVLLEDCVTHQTTKIEKYLDAMTFTKIQMVMELVRIIFRFYKTKRVMSMNIPHTVLRTTCGVSSTIKFT